MYSFGVYCFFMSFVIYGKTQEDKEKSYEGAQVWRTTLRSDDNIDAIVKLVESQDISIWHLERDRADFLVQAQNKLNVNRVLETQKLNHSVLMMDVQRRVDVTKADPPIWTEESLRIGHRLNWKKYPTLKVMDEYFNYIADNFPSICNVITIGKTVENRMIKLVKISNGNPKNKPLIVSSGMHAREWAAITSVLYVLDNIVGKFDQLPNFMKAIDWMFIPVVNPDGYAYTHTHDRLWRKNRRKFRSCVGVDINRNFDIDWNVAGITKKDPCLEGYAGQQAFSEPESRALRDLILNAEKKPLAMLDIHSYGQLILYPWSAKSYAPPDRKMLWKSANIMKKTIYNATGKTYKFGSTYHVIYPATGAGIDWMYKAGVSLSYGIEIGDSQHGFLMPAENIESTGQELLVAVTEFLKKLAPKQIRKTVNDPWF